MHIKKNTQKLSINKGYQTKVNREKKQPEKKRN